MNPQKLSPTAEDIRLKIKAMIPELSHQAVENRAALLKTEKNGNKTYGGDLLGAQISLLSRQLPIPDPENWGWRLLYFAVPTTVTARKRGFLIPLSRETLCDGILKEAASEEASQEEASQEGFYVETAPDAGTKVNSETAAIYFVPR
ncbi:hypothetical protein BJX63DRAFT_416693 [Aspergillus granulosus]|uniref:Uncharacterized protein n=1 Tax=Aspergillus granulosus TaxID=176169 RepID=A0ABR4GRN8_9EURO